MRRFVAHLRRVTEALVYGLTSELIKEGGTHRKVIVEAFHYPLQQIDTQM